MNKALTTLDIDSYKFYITGEFFEHTDAKEKIVRLVCRDIGYKRGCVDIEFTPYGLCAKAKIVTSVVGDDVFYAEGFIEIPILDRGCNFEFSRFGTSTLLMLDDEDVLKSLHSQHQSLTEELEEKRKLFTDSEHTLEMIKAISIFTTQNDM